MMSSGFPGSECVYFPEWEEGPLLGAVGDQGVGQARSTFPSPVGAVAGSGLDSAEAVRGKPTAARARQSGAFPNVRGGPARGD